MGEGKSAIRRIFEGVQFDAYETKILHEFKTFISKTNTVLPPFWTDANVLRFLQGNNWDYEKTLTAIHAHTDWQKKYLPPKYTQEIEDFFKQGIIYLQGRDNHLRPILTIVTRKIDVDRVNVELLIDAITFLFESMVRFMLVPGKVENWVFIMDLRDMGITNIPYMVVILPIRNENAGRL
jgi:hypothetical protein